MSLEEKYPKLMAKITEPVYDIRDLVVVDENYDDIDSDEFDVFEVDEYNFLVYVTDRVQEAVGREKMQKLIAFLESDERFENFFAAEEDMYGVMSDLDENGVAERILRIIEEELV